MIKEKMCKCGHGYSWHSNEGDCTYVQDYEYEEDGACMCDEFEDGESK